MFFGHMFSRQTDLLLWLRGAVFRGGLLLFVPLPWWWKWKRQEIQLVELSIVSDGRDPASVFAAADETDDDVFVVSGGAGVLHDARVRNHISLLDAFRDAFGCVLDRAFRGGVEFGLCVAEADVWIELAGGGGAGGSLWSREQ